MQIDINADVGESFGSFVIGDDENLFKSITSANIACGFHAGDFNVIHTTVKLARENGVAVGAHPGYPDLQGFGRRNVSMTQREIYNMVVYQIGALKIFCDLNGVPLQHVKPHGALYNSASENSAIAEVVAEAVYDTIPHAYLFGLCNGKLIEAGKRIGLKTANEAFADRRYTSEGRLCSRLEKHAVIENFEEILEQVKDIIFHKRVKSISGEWVPILADTICFHGDGGNVVDHAVKLRQFLVQENILVKAIGSIR